MFSPPGDEEAQQAARLVWSALHSTQKLYLESDEDDDMRIMIVKPWECNIAAAVASVGAHMSLHTSSSL